MTARASQSTDVPVNTVIVGSHRESVGASTHAAGGGHVKSFPCYLAKAGEGHVSMFSCISMPARDGKK